MNRNNEDIVFPANVNDLIELLNELYPERSPEISDDVKEIYFQAGQRDVVRFINLLKERLDKNLTGVQ